MNTNLEKLGFTDRFAAEASQFDRFFVGRVASQSKNLYQVMTETGELTAEVSGKFRYSAPGLAAFPAVGDFVMVDRDSDSQGHGIIHHVLARKSVFTRKVAGEREDEQVVAANIDTVFLCMALNNDFNLRRLERYLAIAWDSGALPVVVLTKADLCRDIEGRLAEVAAVSVGADVYVTTSISEEGVKPLRHYLAPGKTVAFIGSSGVGKSSLINRLLGQEVLETRETRSDDKGRHTSTRRELLLLPEGGVVIDTPGMRELGIMGADLGRSFADIEELANHCKFRDCQHNQEPGCAVRAAIEAGELSPERLENYRKLQKEARYEGLDSKMIEKAKLEGMFQDFGGMKNARKYMKEQKKRKGR